MTGSVRAGLRTLGVPLLAVGLALPGAAPARAATTYSAYSQQQFPLPTAGATPAAVLSVNVPAGKWVVESVATVVWLAAGLTGGATYARCGLTTSTGLQFYHAATIGAAGGSATVVTIPAQLAFTAPRNGAVVQLVCQHDALAVGMYVDPGATMIVRPAASSIVVMPQG